METNMIKNEANTQNSMKLPMLEHQMLLSGGLPFMFWTPTGKWQEQHNNK